MANERKTQAGIYVRISRDSAGEGLGVARQRADCEKRAAELGWNVVDVYEDNDVSASRTKPRPEYERMMADVQAGRINGVIVWDVDRLTRQPRELEDVIDHADKVGLKLASVGGDIDLATDQGQMMARMKGTVARYEVQASSRRLRRKHAEMAAAGAHIGPRPFGWDIVQEDTGSNVLRVNATEAAIVRECVERVLRGEGLWRIRNDLVARGVTTSTGGTWQTQTLRRMLLRWRNCGVRTHNGKEAGTGQWEPIIERATHERIVATLTDPARRSNNRGTAVRYLLTGIARCGVCERPVVGTAEYTYEIKVAPKAGSTEPRTRTRHYPHVYKCPHAGCMKVQRRMADVDEYVEAVVVALLLRDGVRVLGGDPAAADHARARVAELEAKLNLAADQYADDIITAEQLARITGRIRPDIDTERGRLRRAMPTTELSAFVTDAAAAWAKADVETHRRVLDVIGVDIVIEPIGAGNGSLDVAESVSITPRNPTD